MEKGELKNVGHCSFDTETLNLYYCYDMSILRTCVLKQLVGLIE